MKTTIKIDNLDVEKEKFDKIKSELERILELKPSEEIKEFSKKMDWTIDQKDVFIKGSKINEAISYRIEFYHNDIKEGKKCYLGSMNYLSPAVI